MDVLDVSETRIYTLESVERKKNNEAEEEEEDIS
jgi:hypothetical protein